MADISKITLPSGSTYDIKDTVAREMASGGVSFVLSVDAATTPYGVQWDDNGTTITGTLVASSSTKSKFYLVPNSYLFSRKFVIKLTERYQDELKIDYRGDDEKYWLYYITLKNKYL